MMRIDKHNPCTLCLQARLRFKLEFDLMEQMWYNVEERGF